jgi:hypothetical protein
VEILGGQMRIGMYLRNGSDKTWGQLGKIVSFLDGKENIYKITDKARSDF